VELGYRGFYRRHVVVAGYGDSMVAVHDEVGLAGLALAGCCDEFLRAASRSRAAAARASSSSVRRTLSAAAHSASP
jgi:hypothetical protein